MDVYEMVTAEVIKKLESGTAPWQKPWIGDGAVAWAAQRPYRGVNTLLLPPGEYATYAAIEAAGGHVKKGEHGYLVVFWKIMEREEANDAGELVKKTIPLLRYYRVFEINTQAEGVTSKRKAADRKGDPITAAEDIMRGYKDGPAIRFASGRAYYDPRDDMVSVPPIGDYAKAEDYYSTMFHECAHSTGHKNRLGRIKDGLNAYASEAYSKEELVAEIASAMLCGKAGIVNRTIDNSAAYLRSWLDVLAGDSRMIVQAASQAQKAADYILGVTAEKNAEEM